MTARDLITATLRSIRVLGLGDVLLAEDANDSLNRLNDWLDGLAMERLTIYHVDRTVVPLIAGKASYTIGISTVTNPPPPPADIPIPRPVAIESAGLIFDTSAPVPFENPVGILTEQRWQGVRQKTLPSPYVQVLYYNYDWQNGIALLFVWPIPNVSNTALILYTPTALKEFTTLDTVYTFPPGYRRFLRTNFAAEIASEYGKQLTTDQIVNARQAKALIKRGNVRPGELRVDAALVRGGDWFDWRTGESGKPRW